MKNFRRDLLSMAVLILLTLPVAWSQTAHPLSAETKKAREARMLWWLEPRDSFDTRLHNCTPAMDTELLNRAPQPASVQEFFAGARKAFEDNPKSGLWISPLLDQIRMRGNYAMLLLGDNAVDDRDSKVGLHRSDYLLRDLSPAWQELAASVPVYATWDDHDYYNTGPFIILTSGTMWSDYVSNGKELYKLSLSRSQLTPSSK